MGTFVYDGEASLVVTNPDAFATISIGNQGKTVVQIHPDGNVTIAEGVELTEASRAFWDAVKHLVKQERP